MKTPVNQPISNFIDSQNGEEREPCCSPRPFCSQCDEKDREIKRLKGVLEASEEKLKELEATNNALLAKVKSLAQLLFGRSTEKDPFPEEEPTEPTETPPPSSVGKDSPGETVLEPIEEDPNPEPTEEDTKTDTPEPNKRKRGGQFGCKGHGRTIPEEIPVEVVIIDVPEEDRTCDICGIPYEPVPFVETSSTIEIKIVIYRREEVRKRYKRACNCEEDNSRFITAPKEPQALEKSKFSHGLIAFLLALKYLYAIPLERAVSFLNLFGAELASSSIIGTFKSLFPLFQALYESMVEALKKAGQWNVDETGYFTYIKQKGKKTFLNWMWVSSTKTMVFV